MRRLLNRRLFGASLLALPLPHKYYRPFGNRWPLVPHQSHESLSRVAEGQRGTSIDRLSA